MTEIYTSLDDRIKQKTGEWGVSPETLERIMSQCKTSIFQLLSGTGAAGKTTLAKANATGPLPGFSADFNTRHYATLADSGASLTPELYTREADPDATMRAFGAPITKYAIGAPTGQEDFVQLGAYRIWIGTLMGPAPESSSNPAFGDPSWKRGLNATPMSNVMVFNASIGRGRNTHLEGTVRRQQTTLEASWRYRPLGRWHVNLFGSHFDLVEADHSEWKTRTASEIQGHYSNVLAANSPRETYFELISPFEEFLLDDSLYEMESADALSAIDKKFGQEVLHRICDEGVILGGEYNSRQNRIVGGDEIPFPVMFDLQEWSRRIGRRVVKETAFTMGQAQLYISSPRLDIDDLGVSRNLPNERFAETGAIEMMKNSVRTVNEDLMGSIGNPYVVYDFLSQAYAEREV